MSKTDSDSDSSNDSDDADHDVTTTECRDVIDWQARITEVLRADNDEYDHNEGDSFNEFHASKIGYPIRQVFADKVGVSSIDDDGLGRVHTGSLVHEWIENNVSEGMDNVVVEQPCSTTVPGVGRDITFVGTFDAYDYVNGVVYDFKTRGGWYNFDPPVQRHIDQLQVYMHALGAIHGKVVYVNKKSTTDVRTFPEADDETVMIDHERVEGHLADKADRVLDAIEDHGIPESAEDIPFEKSDHYFDQSETLDFGGDPPGWVDDTGD